MPLPQRFVLRVPPLARSLRQLLRRRKRRATGIATARPGLANRRKELGCRRRPRSSRGLSPGWVASSQPCRALLLPLPAAVPVPASTAEAGRYVGTADRAQQAPPNTGPRRRVGISCSGPPAPSQAQAARRCRRHRRRRGASFACLSPGWASAGTDGRSTRPATAAATPRAGNRPDRPVPRPSGRRRHRRCCRRSTVRRDLAPSSPSPGARGRRGAVAAVHPPGSRRRRTDAGTAGPPPGGPGSRAPPRNRRPRPSPRPRRLRVSGRRRRSLCPGRGRTRRQP